MVLVKVLKRKDGASVIVAVVLAMIILQPLTTVVVPLTNKIVANHGNGYYGAGGSWKDNYLSPAVMAILQIVLLEILTWVYVLCHRVVARRSK